MGREVVYFNCVGGGVPAKLKISPLIAIITGRLAY